MKNFIRGFCLLLMLSAPWGLFAQTNIFKGMVSSSTGVPLSGASVSIKGGAGNGTATDATGRFQLSANSSKVTLVVSFVGMIPKEVVASAGEDLRIILDNVVQEGEEVVVIGYGTQKKRNVTAAVSSVSGKDLREIIAPGLDQALQGRAAGVQVTKNTGAPGGGVSIRVRGTASLLGGQEPLYVIDGIPITNSPTGSADVFNVNRNGGVAGNEFVNPLSQIPIDDIESIEILKDAASAGIYGARAANGVVLITTKKGKAGKMEISFNGYTGFNDIPRNRRYNMLDGPGFAEASNYTRRIRNLPILFADSLNVSSTDWQDEVFQRGVVTSVNVGINGGTEKIRLSFGAGYFKQEGTIVGTNFDRINLRNSIDFTLSKKVKAGANLLISRSRGDRLRNTGSGAGTDAFNNNNFYGPSVLSAALIANPTYRPFTPAGLYNADTLNNTISPIATAREVELLTTDDRIIGNTFLEFEPVKGLKLRTNWGVDLRNSIEEYHTPFIPGVFNGAATGASLENGNFNEYLWLTENYATYDFRVKGDHHFNLLAGFSAQESRNKGLAIRVRNIPSNDLLTASSGTQILGIKEQGFQFWGIVSQFARLNYDFNNKYLFTATFRRDGSSRFGPESRYGNFPAFSAGWIVSEEKFFQKIPAISFLKLRASYGRTGNDQIGNVWTWRASMQPLPSGTTSYLGLAGSRPASIEVGNFSWETTDQSDLGIDVELWNNKLSFTADYYYRLTTGLLYGISLPNTTGFSSTINNLGSMRNSGLEFAVTSKNIQTKNFSWTTSFNISFNRNKLLGLYEGRTQDSYGDFGKATLLRVGEPISWQGVRVLGINPDNGDFIVDDVDRNNVINDNDMVVLGSPLPKGFGGFTNNFTFKGFDLNVFFYFNYGNKIYNTTRSYLETANIPTGNATIANTTRERWEGRWQQPGDIAQYRGFDPANTYNAVGSRISDFYLEDGSFIKLRSLSFGYNLPKSLLNRWKLAGARFYVNGNNLLVFTKYSGFDPEVNHNNIGTNITVGYDTGTYPQGRSFVFGFNINF